MALPKGDEAQRNDEQSGDEERADEHGVDAVPDQQEGGLVLGGCARSVVEVGQRRRGNVRQRPGHHHGQPHDAQDGSEQRRARAPPAQRAVQPQGVDDPRQQGSEMEGVLHRPCRLDVGEPRERLLGGDVHPDEGAHDAEGDEHEEAAEDAGASWRSPPGCSR